MRVPESSLSPAPGREFAESFGVSFKFADVTERLDATTDRPHAVLGQCLA
jgi:hypothetical protein